jgi:hypothetical protein
MPGDMTTIVIIGYRLYHSIVHDSIEIAGIKLSGYLIIHGRLMVSMHLATITF